MVKMLKGELSEEERKRWEWDRKLEGRPNDLVPKREIDDL